MRVAEDADRIRQRRFSAEDNTIQLPVEVRQEKLHRITPRPRMDLSRWQFASRQMLERFRILAKLLRSEDFRRLRRVVARLVLGRDPLLVFAPDAAIEAFLATGELDEAFPRLPAQDLQRSVPWTLLALLPLRCRVKTGVPPDVADRRRLVDVDVRQHSGRDDRPDTVDALHPLTHRVSFDIPTERALDLAFKRQALHRQPRQQFVRFNIHRPDLTVRPDAIVLHLVVGIDHETRFRVRQRRRRLGKVARQPLHERQQFIRESLIKSPIIHSVHGTISYLPRDLLIWSRRFIIASDACVSFSNCSFAFTISHLMAFADAIASSISLLDATGPNISSRTCATPTRGCPGCVATLSSDPGGAYPCFSSI